MQSEFSRSALLIGESGIEKLNKSRVAVFGVGGVGGFVVEALARTGVGAIDIIDNDKVCLSNINRQLIATHKTLGKFKVDVFEERILDINPNCKVTKHNVFYLPTTKDLFDFSQYDYVVDAIDTVTGKIGLITQAKESGVPIISSMGAGNKLDPTKFEVADIYQTSICPLARVMRRELKKRGIQSLKVVYSKEEATRPISFINNSKLQNGETANEQFDKKNERKQTTGSLSFVPSVAGLIVASEVIKDLLKNKKDGTNGGNDNV